jgi:hypothetical protein
MSTEEATDSGIPLLSNLGNMPSTMKLNYSDMAREIGENKEFDKGILLSTSRSNSEGDPYYVLNISSFVTPPKVIILPDGTIQQKKKGIEWAEKLESEAYPKLKIKKIETSTKKLLTVPDIENKSLLDNILYFLSTKETAQLTGINKNITLPIIKEWLRQYMISKQIKDYDKDIDLLLNKNSKLEILKKLFPKNYIMQFDLITDSSLLEEDEKLTNGKYIRYDKEYFKEITKDELDQPLYILLIFNNNSYSLLCVDDNSTFKSYYPIYNNFKSQVDEIIAPYLRKKQFSYVPDAKRKLTREQIDFLPNVDTNVLEYDLCIAFMRQLLDGRSYDEVIKDAISKEEYYDMYLELIRKAMKL